MRRNMKSLAVAGSLAAVIMLFTQCEKLLTVNRDFTTPKWSFDLPPIPASGPFDISQAAPLDISKQLEAINLTPIEVQELHAKEVTIEMVDSTGRVTFDALDKVYLELSGRDLPTAVIAFKDPVPHDGRQTLLLDADQDINLLPYAQATSVVYRIYGSSNAPTTASTKMSVQIKWHVKAKLFE